MSDDDNEVVIGENGERLDLMGEDGKISVEKMVTKTRTELLDIARGLLVWNCNQPISDAEHHAHHKKWIEPIHKHLDERWERIVMRRERRRTDKLSDEQLKETRKLWSPKATSSR